MLDLQVSRRRFLAQSSAVAAGLALGSRFGLAQATAAEPLYKISLAQWSLQREFFNSLGDPRGRNAQKPIDPQDFAKVAKEDFGLEAVEYVNTFYRGKETDSAYIAELKKRADDLGVRSLLIMCDGEGNLGDPDDARRAETVEKHKKWIDMAKTLGCHSIRVNAASSGSFEEQQKLAADGLTKLTEVGKAAGLNVIVENHGGLSSNGEWLAGVMKLVNLPECGTLPDFGNFRLGGAQGNYDRYKGVEELMPFAKGVSAKSYDFGEDGNETTIDYKRMLKIVLDHGYRGYVGVEYEGTRLPPYEGIKATKALLEKVRDELTKENA